MLRTNLQKEYLKGWKEGYEVSRQDLKEGIEKLQNPYKLSDAKYTGFEVALLKCKEILEEKK